MVEWLWLTLDAIGIAVLFAFGAAIVEVGYDFFRKDPF